MRSSALASPYWWPSRCPCCRSDPAERERNYKEALDKISGELYWLSMFTYAKYYVFSSDLDFKTTPDEIPRFYTAKWK